MAPKNPSEGQRVRVPVPPKSSILGGLGDLAAAACWTGRVGRGPLLKSDGPNLSGGGTQ